MIVGGGHRGSTHRRPSGLGSPSVPVSTPRSPATWGLHGGGPLPVRIRQSPSPVGSNTTRRRRRVTCGSGIVGLSLNVSGLVAHPVVLRPAGGDVGEGRVSARSPSVAALRCRPPRPPTYPPPESTPQRHNMTGSASAAGCCRVPTDVADSIDLWAGLLSQTEYPPSTRSVWPVT